jgi:hypothetical protein
MPVVAEIKLVIDQFAQSVKAIIDYFRQISDSAKEAGKNVAKSFQGEQISDTLNKLMTGKQKGIKDIFGPMQAGGSNLTGMLAGITKAFQAGSFAASGLFATSLNMVATALRMLGPEFAVVIAGAAGIAAAFAGLIFAVKAAVNGVKEYTELSAKAMSLGLKPETLKVLEIAFQRVGGDAYAASTALDKFFANIYSAKDGATEAYNALRVLSQVSGENLLPANLIKMPNEEAFMKVLSALKLINNETQRLAISNKLFTGFTGTSGLFLKSIIDKDVISKTTSDLNPMLSMQSKISGSLIYVGETGRKAMSMISSGASLVGQMIAAVGQSFAQFWEGAKLSERIGNIFVSIADAIAMLKPLLSLVGTILAGFAGALIVIGNALAGVFNLMAAVFAAVYKGIQLVVLGVLMAVDGLTKLMTLGLGGTKFADNFSAAMNAEEGFLEPQKAPGASLPIQAFAPVQAAISSSLTKVGGGGSSFGAGANDPMYDLGRQQLRVQEQIRDALQKNAPVSTPGGSGQDFVWN